MSKVIAQFVPKHFEKAIDLARSVATFGQLEFGLSSIRLRVTDPVKVLHVDLELTPTAYRAETEFVFGVNLQMFYKLLKSLDNNDAVEIEADETAMKINQCQHYHTLIAQPLDLALATIEPLAGTKITLATKLFQRYIRALHNAAPVVELHYVPASSVLFLESVSSMYRTLFSMDTTSAETEGGEEYRKSFILKFLDTAINPSLSDKVELTLGPALSLTYTTTNMTVTVTQAGYTEG
jgi:hypothetical protein